MWQHSSNPEQTAQIIEADLKRRFPGGCVEIFYRTLDASGEQYWNGELPAAMQKIQQGCEGCSGADFHYDPGHKYGMVCTAVCTCKKPRPACSHWAQRPRVMVLLTHNGARDVLIGQRGTPSPCLVEAGVE